MQECGTLLRNPFNIFEEHLNISEKHLSVFLQNMYQYFCQKTFQYDLNNPKPVDTFYWPMMVIVML